MKARVVQGVPTLISLIGIVSWYEVAKCAKDAVCGFHAYAVNSIFSLFAPLWAYSICALIPSIFVLFVSKKAFISWIKFAIGWTIFSITVLAMIAPEEHSWLSLGFVRENAAWIMGGLFVLISVALLTWKSFRSKNLFNSQ